MRPRELFIDAHVVDLEPFAGLATAGIPHEDIQLSLTEVDRRLPLTPVAYPVALSRISSFTIWQPQSSAPSVERVPTVATARTDCQTNQAATMRRTAKPAAFIRRALHPIGIHAALPRSPVQQLTPRVTSGSGRLRA
ncbi:hypothetical protein GCM10023320_08670 [Pseudonocardia adelaidensis]|uniref:Uncharacterized protein n=1 Tax=Pseudonocardia adelaidensis TaxID=648754 RepID=A0ABP9NE27_9PSEU